MVPTLRPEGGGVKLGRDQLALSAQAPEALPQFRHVLIFEEAARSLRRSGLADVLVIHLINFSFILGAALKPARAPHFTLAPILSPQIFRCGSVRIWRMYLRIF